MEYKIEDIKIERYPTGDWTVFNCRKPNSRVIVFETEEQAREHAVAICAQREADRTAALFGTKIQRWAVEITPVEDEKELKKITEKLHKVLDNFCGSRWRDERTDKDYLDNLRKLGVEIEPIKKTK